ncbi:MAG: YkgJ family cysteine cluster protein [Chloroflexi bacterium]|nr:YkgJ family cysteine cluster protein [Chloroflexota bacterium]
MTDKPRKRPKCSTCGKCCRAPVILITKPSDLRRWAQQGRSDILRYASVPVLRGYGDLWISIDGSEGSGYCPFIRRVSQDKFTCTIQDTKPKVCKEFWCEWTYGVGQKGIPFKTDRGWTDRAKQLGYGQSTNRSRQNASVQSHK